jgi:pimeloyl-ACP methyl ester carboxylesterase
MVTYVLIPGAGSDSWYWHLVVPRLEAEGHRVVAVDLPCGDDAAGLDEYTDEVIAAVAPELGRRPVVLVAQSMGGLSAPLVADRLPGAVQLIVLVAAMVPAPGEAPGDWWANTGHAEALQAQAERDGREVGGDFDPVEVFLHDLPPAVLADALARGGGEQSGTPFEKPWPLDAWPDVPTRFLLCRHDRFFPADFQRRVVRERLGIVPDEMDGGHLPALHSPDELVERLEAYRIAAGID